MNRTAKDNAHEFGALTKQGYGVRLAVLVACSVEPASHGGNRRSSSTLNLKVTAAGFAAEAGVSPGTVKNYLDKWDRMVAAGWDSMNRAGLTPEDAEIIAITDKFVSEFDALAVSDGGTPENGLTGKAADIAKNTKAMTAAILADPKVAKAARKALSEADQPSDEFARKAAYSAEQEEARAERRPWVFYQGRLHAIIETIKVAAKEAGRPGRFTGEEREFLLNDISRAKEGLAMLEACIQGDAVDWDSALADLTAGEVQ